MAIAPTDVNTDQLKRARQVAGTASNRETVALALQTLIAVRCQPSTIQRIISRRFEPGQIDAPTTTPGTEHITR